jgi:hypothetical protein
MTEREWLHATDPNALLMFLRQRRQAGDRKLRLFAVACCRRLQPLFGHPDSLSAIEVAERFAEGDATTEELRHAEELAMWAGDDASWHCMQEAAVAWAAAAPAQDGGMRAAHAAVYEIRQVYAGEGPKRDEEDRAQCDLLREVIGNPFRPVTVQPARRLWNQGTVAALARAIYDERAFDRLPVLADALEEAGCDNEAVLAHLRGPGPHVRGCWAVDRLLGKEETR